jgi:hypothetical protein
MAERLDVAAVAKAFDVPEGELLREDAAFANPARDAFIKQFTDRLGANLIDALWRQLPWYWRLWLRLTRSIAVPQPPAGSTKRD